MNNLGTWWRTRTLHSENAEERIQAIEALAGASGPKALEPLLEALYDDDPYVRAKAAHGLGEIRQPEAIEPLVAILLTEREHFVSNAAVDALERLDNGKVMETLLLALNDPDPTASHNAAAGLRRVGWDKMTKLQRARVAVLQHAWEEVAELGAAAVGPLEAALRGAGPEDVSREAAEALGTMHAPEALAALLRALTDPEVERAIRETTVIVLRQGGLERLQETDRARVAILEGDWPEVRRLGKAAIEPLRAALSDQKLGMRERAAEALGQIGDADAVAKLVAALGDPGQDWVVREAAARTLGQIADARYAPALVAALCDEGWKVREAAAESLHAVGWEPTDDVDRARVMIVRTFWEDVTALGEAAIEPLVDALKYSDVATAAARALGEIRPRGLDKLLDVLHSHDRPMAVREVVAAALAENGDLRAVEPMVAMLDDPDMVVRQSAVWTLQKLGWEPRDERQQALAAVANEDWDALGALGPAAVEPLLALARDSLAPQETVASLCDLLQQSAERLSVDQLRAMAGLRDIPIPEPPMGTDNTGDAGQHPTVVECGAVRQLARVELTNRGIMA